MTNESTGNDDKPLFGGPFGIALVVAVLAAIAAIPLLMKLAPSPEDSAANDTASNTMAASQIGSDDDAASAASATSDIRKGTMAIKEFSATDVGTGDLIGGRIMLVSASGPGVVMFDNGKRYTAGTVMPNGHVIDSIESDRIVLEREKVVSVVRLQ